MLGQLVGSYRIIDLLGRGGMGVVYVGEHTMIERRAAIKVLLPELSHNQDMVRRFFNEAKAANAINHPGIVAIHDFGYHTDHSAYIVMELLEGETLGDRLKRHGALRISDALVIARQVAGALGAAHDAGIVHRDLKPDNIFMIRDPEVPGGERIKLLDFGIAKLSDVTVPDGERTRTGTIMGTPKYMSPEQCRGGRDVDHRSDLYALGCILYRMVCGRAPFEAVGNGEIMAAHIHVPVEPPRTHVPTLPSAIDRTILQLLQKPPERRYQRAHELIEALDQALDDPGAHAATRAGRKDSHGPGVSTLGGAAGVRAPRTAGPRASRVGTIIALVAVVAVAIAIAVVVLVGDHRASGHADAGATASVTDARPPDARAVDASPPATEAECERALDHIATIMSDQLSQASFAYRNYARYRDTPAEAARQLEACAQSYDRASIACFTDAASDVDVARCSDALSERQCARGDHVGCVATGWRLYVQQRYDQAATRAQAACDNAVSSGCSLLATLHYYGRGRPVDYPAARALFERGYALGDADAGAALAELLWHGIGGEGEAVDVKRARALYEEICADHPGHGGCANLGLMTSQGLGGRKSRTAARRHYEAACRVDHPRGCVLLADTRRGRAARELYVKAHARYELNRSYSPRSEFRIAELIRDGKGVTRDRTRAADLFERACSDNEPLACVALGDLSVSGRISLDLKRSTQAFERACKAGIPRGCDGVQCQRLLAADDRPDDWVARIRKCRKSGLLPRKTRRPESNGKGNRPGIDVGIDL